MIPDFTDICFSLFLLAVTALIIVMTYACILEVHTQIKISENNDAHQVVKFKN